MVCANAMVFNGLQWNFGATLMDTPNTYSFASYQKIFGGSWKDRREQRRRCNVKQYIIYCQSVILSTPYVNLKQVSSSEFQYSLLRLHQGLLKSVNAIACFMNLAIIAS